MSSVTPVVAPLRAIRYQAATGDLSALLAPPFDVIGAEEQAWLHQQHPHNVVRLELGKSFPTDTPADNCYLRAAATLRSWLAEGVLAQDDPPGIYPYRHSFLWQGQLRRRLGCFCLVRLSEFSQGVVLPHEDTRPRAKADRRELLHACQAQISPVFGLYRQGGEAARLLASCLQVPPAARAALGQEQLELWRVTDPALIAAWQQALGAGPFVIADGHHRYETALAYRDEMRQSHPQAGPEAAFSYVLMMLVAADDPGLVVLPTTRLLKLGGRGRPAVEDAAAKHFERAPAALQPGAIAPVLRQLADRGRRAYAVFTREGWLLLTLKPEVPIPTDPRGALDVSLLQHLLVDQLLPPAVQDERLAYVMGETDPCRAVAGGNYDAAIFLNPPQVDQVLAVAASGQRMPPKSSYFHPKPPTGLVINPVAPGPA